MKKKTTQQPEKTKQVPNSTFQKINCKKTNGAGHIRSTSNRYNEGDMNLNEQTLASPVQEKSVPRPTEDPSNKCHQLAQ